MTAPVTVSPDTTLDEEFAAWFAEVARGFDDATRDRMRIAFMSGAFVMFIKLTAISLTHPDEDIAADHMNALQREMHAYFTSLK